MRDDSALPFRADRERLAQAIKRELSRRIWMDNDDHVDRSRYTSLFIANPVPTWIYDVATLAVLDVNEAAVERYGYSRDEFLCLTVKDLRPGDDVAKFMLNWWRRRAGQDCEALSLIPENRTRRSEGP